VVEIEVDVGSGRPCHRCNEVLILLAQVPHVLIGSDGSHVAGTRGVGLCAACDRHDPDAQGLLAFFAVHETVTDETVHSIASLLNEWIGRVADRRASSEREIRDEVDRYFNSDDSNERPEDGG
jgi:hypothetical protein